MNCVGVGCSSPSQIFFPLDSLWALFSNSFFIFLSSSLSISLSNFLSINLSICARKRKNQTSRRMEIWRTSLPYADDDGEGWNQSQEYQDDGGVTEMQEREREKESWKRKEKKEIEGLKRERMQRKKGSKQLCPLRRSSFWTVTLSFLILSFYLLSPSLLSLSFSPSEFKTWIACMIWLPKGWTCHKVDYCTCAHSNKNRN